MAAAAATTTTWESLPLELRAHIRSLAAAALARDARRIQAHWWGYRTRALCGRYRMLHYLRGFREWNPSLAVFLARSRL